LTSLNKKRYTQILYKGDREATRFVSFNNREEKMKELHLNNSHGVHKKEREGEREREREKQNKIGS